ncbi:PAS domain-containing sensor histidine kinase [Zeaxanthinibacter enoshimensis]|uniref:histidine kinase n=1 Tax=Zeaxanthinibacter enoshimensis TaxID=392009 RepID=A0A4R6TFI3_9FLAO|nr:PAS domain-containing protein [Zeaxanthinibacter enoshimensis]TDQ29075.1 PAS domain S-box-containing protein [Zeaxanthinibacter enoshimensis]
MSRTPERQVGFDIIQALPKSDFENIAFLAANNCQVSSARIFLADSEVNNFCECGNSQDQSESYGQPVFQFLLSRMEGEFYQTNERDILKEIFGDKYEIPGEIGYLAALPFATEFPNLKGILCLINTQPRSLNKSEESAFRMLGDQCTRIIEHTRLKRNFQKIQERLDVATSLGHLGYWELDLDTYHLEWSAEISQMMELTAAPDLAGYEDFARLVVPGDRAVFEKEIALILNGEKDTLDLKHQVKLPNGNIKWLHQRGHLVKSKDNKALVFRGTTQDITDTELREQSIKHHLDFIETTLNNIPLGIIVNRISDGRVTYLNPNFTTILGWKLEEVGDIGDVIKKCVPDPELRKKYYQKIEEYLGSGRDGILAWKEIEAYTKTNERLVVNINTIPLFDQDLVISTVVDESEAYNNKAALRDINERYDYVSQATWDTIYDWDIENNALYWSDNFAENLGYTDHVDPNINFSEWSSRLHPEDNDRVQESLEQALQGKALNWNSYYRFKHADGHYLRLQDRGFIIRDPSGKAVRMVGAMQDVTEEYEKERRLELYASAIKNTKDAILITEVKPEISPADYPIVFANTAYEKLSGYKLKELKGQTPRILHGPRTDTSVIREALKVLENDKPMDVDIVNYSKDGEPYYVNLSISPVVDDDNHITHYISIQREISFRKAEQVNRDLVQQVSHIFSRSLSVGDTLDLVTEAVGRTVNAEVTEMWLFGDYNQQLELVSGYAINDKFSSFYKDVSTVDLAKDDALYASIYQQVSNIYVRGIGAEDSGFTRYRQAKELGLDVAYGIPLLAEKKIIGVLVVFNIKANSSSEDLMDRRLQDMPYYLGSEIRRKKLLDQLELIFASVPDLICTADSSGYIKKINQSVTENFGYEISEVIGRHFTEFVYPEDLEKSVEEFKRVVVGDATPYFEIRYMTKAGEPRWLAWSINVPDKGGDIFCVAKDITDKKSIEKELLLLNKELYEKNSQLAASNTELEHFAYVASHDLQEPLRMIGSFLTQLDKKYKPQLDERAQTYINFAVDGAKRMRTIIQDLLDYSRVGQFEEAKEEFPVQEVIDEIQILYKNLLEEKEATLVIPEPLPTVYTVRVLLSQVIQNLIDNSLKYSKEEVPPVITLRWKDSDTHWIFEVTDNGIGIEQEFREKIFIIFQRLQTKKIQGSGMGLAITKKIVEKLGGTIMVESEVGQGSTFLFSIRKK